jgi:hypothetical protein
MLGDFLTDWVECIDNCGQKQLKILKPEVTIRRINNDHKQLCRVRE